MQKRMKFVSLVCAVALAAVCLAGVVVAAAGDTVNISTPEQLVEAINNQKEGQTWVLAEGTYDIGDGCIENGITINGQTGFVFPIAVNNLTIKGTGNVIITSSYNPNTGNWFGQNFITVGGTGVTIQDVKLQGNPNGYYDNLCNKVVELAGEGKDLTLKNVECLPLTYAEDQTQTSGSIYIDVVNAGNTVLENVTLSSWISARRVTDGTVTAKNVTQDFSNNTYAGYSTPENGYAWNPGISGENVVLEGFTIQVDDSAEFIQQIVKNLKPGTTIELMSDIEVSEEVYINGIDNVTIKGNGHTITAADDFKMNIEGQINLFKIEADNVVLDDVKLVATAANKHTLDIYGAKGVVLNNVTLDHQNASTGAPMVNNGSEVSVTGAFEVITGDQSWYAVNVDNKAGNASITFEEDSTLKFEDKSSAGDKTLIYAQNTNTEAEAPVVTSKSDEVKLDTDENGVISIHTHAFGTEWKSDETHHWHVCACGEIADKAEHTYKDGKCTVCGAENPMSDDKGTGDMAMIPAVALLVISTGVFAIKTLRKKEQN